MRHATSPCLLATHSRSEGSRESADSQEKFSVKTSQRQEMSALIYTIFLFDDVLAVWIYH